MQYRLINRLLLKEKTQKGFSLEDQIKLVYVELTIKLDPEKLCLVLEQFPFPLDEVLHICLKNSHFYGAAYIKFRLGKKIEAMADYMRILDEEIASFKKNESKSSRQSTAINAEFAFERIVQICVQSVKDEGNSGVQNFKRFLSFLINIYSQISTDLEKLLLAENEASVDETLEAEYLSLYELKRWIRENYIFELFYVMFRVVEQEANEMIQDESFIRSLDLLIIRHLL